MAQSFPTDKFKGNSSHHVPFYYQTLMNKLNIVIYDSKLFSIINTTGTIK